MKKLLGVVGIISLVLLAGFGIAVALGYAYVGVKSPGQKANVSYRVCSGDIVKQFNGFDPATPEEEKKQLSEMVVKVKATPNNEQDPTCQTILFVAALRTEDYESMKRPMELVKGMYDKGIYIDSNLRFGYTVEAMEGLLAEVILDAKNS